MRRTKLTKQAARVVSHLVSRHDMTQSEIAAVLGVHRSFITRCKNGEREFGQGHLARLAEHFGVPLGAFLLSVSPPQDDHPNAKVREIHRLATELMHDLDRLRAGVKANAGVDAAASQRTVA